KIKDYNYKPVAFNIPERTPGEPDKQTREMIKHVAHAVSQIDVRDVKYILNNQKVNLLSTQLQTLQGNKRVNYLFNYGIELLNAGKTEESIKILKEVLAAMEATNTESKEDK